MTKREAELIIGLAQNNLNVAKTAEKMRWSRQTLLFYMNRVKEETGADPKRFRDMCRLLPMAEDVLQVGFEGLPHLELFDSELVIRCRDCKFWLEEYGEVCSREEDWFYSAPDDFCSRAVVRK